MGSNCEIIHRARKHRALHRQIKTEIDPVKRSLLATLLGEESCEIGSGDWPFDDRPSDPSDGSS